MRRRILITLLALGTVGGYTSGFASLRSRSHHCRSAWTELEQHASQTCAPCPGSFQAPTPTSAEPPTPPGPR